MKSVFFNLLFILLLLMGFNTPALSVEKAWDGLHILAGGFSLSDPKLDEETGSAEYFLSYPSFNYDYPKMPFGVYVHLDQPLTQRQYEQIEHWKKNNKASEVVLYVQVNNCPDSCKGSDLYGKALGFGDYPTQIFEPFTTSDLNERVFQPFQ